MIATGMWRDATDEPLPKLPPADPVTQIEEFEIRLVDLLCDRATPDNAREVAERTWDMVHDRPEGERVKDHVTHRHQELAKMAHTPFGDLES